MKRLFKKQMNKRPNKRRRILIVLIIFLGLAASAYSITNHFLYRMPCGGYPENALYYDVANAIQKNDNEKLQGYVNEIKTQRGYEGSINCLYPLFYSSVQSEDTYQAEQYLSKMQEAIAEEEISSAYKKLGFDSVVDAKKQLDKLINKRIDDYNVFFF